MTKKRNELYIKLRRVFGVRMAYRLTVRIVK